MPRESTVDREPQHRQGHDDPNAAPYWDIRDVQFHCRMGRSTAGRLVRADGFSAPVLCGKRTVLWPRDEVLVFLDSRRDPGHYRRAVLAA